MRTARSIACAVLLSSVGTVLSAIQVQAATCPAGTKKLDHAPLVFCWPVAERGPTIDHESKDSLGGYAYWLHGERIAWAEMTGDADKEEDLVRAGFAITREDAVFTTARPTWEIDPALSAAVALLKPDTKSFQVTLDAGIHARQAFDFYREAPTVFRAKKLFYGRIDPEELEHWVVIRKDGAIDYVLSCSVLDNLFGTSRQCETFFRLPENVVSVGLSLNSGGGMALRRFEELRDQILSYLIEPELPPE